MQTLQFELMKGALEHARFGLCVVDASGRVLLVNSVFASKLERSVESILGQSYILLSELIRANASAARLFNPREQDLSMEVLFTQRDGKRSYLLLQSSKLTHSSGEVFRIVSLTDVTDYGVTRDRFVELQRQMDAVNNAVVIVDATAPDMPITYVNAHFERMTGYHKSEIIGRNCRFLQGKETNQEGLKTLRAALKSRESCHVTLKNFRKDGSMFINELYMSPVFNEASELTHFIGMQHEATNKSFAPNVLPNP
jgi:PAS domain S-box-containing protein